ncbi:MAG TPA: hypothetical protein VN634_02255 [Candidatus Limnocylindrales bacterium]|nr:hypothetical protein [Candidatus Limnocylindrales bacterium]
MEEPGLCGRNLGKGSIGYVRPNVAGTFAQIALLAALVAVAGCSAGRPGAGTQDNANLSPADLARASLSAGNLVPAETILGEALKPRAGTRKTAAQTPETAELLLLRAELRIRQGRYPEAESDALTAMALVPATPDVEPAPASAPAPPAGAKPATPPPPAKPPLTQRAIHLRMAKLYEDVGRDPFAEHHIQSARDLCLADAALVEKRECEREREALVRIRIARGRWADAEPLVLANIAEVQSRYGPEDIRLSVALCEAARFYARQGSYALSGPLFARSFSLWKVSHEEALAEHRQAIAQGQPSPFDAEFLRPRAGNIVFAAPCGLQEQPGILYKLGLATAAADAARYEQHLWAVDTAGAEIAVRNLDALVARNASPFEMAPTRNAIAFVARKKGDLTRAEQELRLATEAYAAAWPTLPISERRYVAPDYLEALESLVEILRGSQRFPEAIELGERAIEVAAAAVDAYDSLRLDTLLSQAITYREMRDAERAETAAGVYLDAVRKARGDQSADYAWALRTISFAYLLREELDASQRMEMQAKAIWAKQGAVAPEFSEGQEVPRAPRPSPEQRRTTTSSSRGRAARR